MSAKPIPWKRLRSVLLQGLVVLMLVAMGYLGTMALLPDRSGKGGNTAPGQAASANQAPSSSSSADHGSAYTLGQTLGQAASKPSAPKGLEGVVAQYRDLEWEALIPKDWDPMAAFKGLDLASLKDNDPRAQQALTKMRQAWNQAPINPELNRQQVRMAGFAIPVEQSEAGVSELLLVPYFGACIHTPPPPANQVVHVRLAEPQPAIGAMQAYWVWGTLRTVRASNTLGDAAYTLEALGAVPYE